MEDGGSGDSVPDAGNLLHGAELPPAAGVGVPAVGADLGALNVSAGAHTSQVRSLSNTRVQVTTLSLATQTLQWRAVV